MPNWNYDLLLKNIHVLKEKEGISQTALAEAIGMSEPNFNKAYKNTDGKRFNLEQVVALANHFNTSVDSLLGDNATHEISNREICAFIIKLYESRLIKFNKLTIKENGYIPIDAPIGPGEYPCSFEEVTNSYNAIYFQRFLNPDLSDLDEYDQWAIDNDFMLNGNDSEDSKIINAFLEKFERLYDMHYAKQLSDDEYRLLINNALDAMK